MRIPFQISQAHDVINVDGRCPLEGGDIVEMTNQ